ncbi:MAG: GatB/YqeY domain-containing protein, partial [Bacteroidia bacterium]
KRCTFAKILKMGIEEKLNADIKTAMLAKDAKKLEALRAMKSVVLLLKTSPEGLTEESATKALQKEVKKRRETAEIYNTQNRADLAEVETSQADVIETYLPKQMSGDELKAEVAKIIAQVGASSPADMGKVMGVASKALAGKADGKAISEVVKQLLAK